MQVVAVPIHWEHWPSHAIHVPGETTGYIAIVNPEEHVRQFETLVQVEQPLGHATQRELELR